MEEFPKNGIKTEIKNEEILEKETGINRLTLEKIRGNPTLRKVFHSLVLSVGLFLGSQESFGQERQENSERIEKQESVKDKNLKLLSAEERVIPSDVFRIFQKIVDLKSSENFTIPQGVFLTKNFLDTEDRLENFQKELLAMSCTEEQADKYVESFSEGNIVYNEDALSNEDFVNIVAHERFHKITSQLTENDRGDLNEARDFIIQNYLESREEFIQKEDKLYEEFFKDRTFSNEEERRETYEKYATQIKLLLDQHNVILRDKEGQCSSIFLDIVVKRPNEFYTHLMMGKLNPSIENYIKSNFPKAFRIFDHTRATIYGTLRVAK